MIDCAETRALVALLVDAEVRAYLQLRSLGPRERADCARACRRLAELCEDLESVRPSWDRLPPMS